MESREIDNEDINWVSSPFIEESQEIIEESPQNEHIRSAIEIIQGVGAKQAQHLERADSNITVSQLRSECKALKQNFFQLVNAVNTINHARAHEELDGTSFKRQVLLEKEILATMLGRLGELRTTLETTPRNKIDAQKLERTLGKLEKKVENASQHLSTLVSFHSEREQLQQSIGQMQHQHQRLHQDHMDYSSFPLAQALSCVSFDSLMSKEQKTNLPSLAAPIRQSIESLATTLPSHGKEFRSTLGSELKETWAQTALAVKRVHKGEGQSHANAVLGLHHWRHLCAEYQAYHTTLVAGKSDLVKTIDFLKHNPHASTRGLTREYTRLLEQLENEMQQTEPLLSWINDHNSHIETSVAQANQFVLQNPASLNYVLGSVLQVTHLKDSPSHQDMLAWNRASLQLHALLDSVPPSSSPRFGPLRYVESKGKRLDEELIRMDPSRSIFNQATRIVYRQEISAVTPGKKMRIEEVAYESALGVLEDNGTHALDMMNEQVNALEGLSQNYSLTALKGVIAHSQTLLACAQYYQTKKQTPEMIRRVDHDIAAELNEIVWNVRDFSDTLVTAIESELAEVSNLPSVPAERREWLNLMVACRDLLVEEYQNLATELQPLQPSNACRVQKQFQLLVETLDDTARDLKKITDRSNYSKLSSEEVFEKLATLPLSKNQTRLRAFQAQKEQEKDYSETKKQLINLAILAMVGGSWLNEGMNLLSKGEQLRASAEFAAQQLRDSVPLQVTSDASFIGTMLSDKLHQLRTFSDAQFQAVTKRHPDTRDILETFRHSSNPISRQDIYKVMDGYITQQAVRGQQHQTVGGWLDAFFTQQSVSEHLQTTPNSRTWKADLDAQLRKLVPVHHDTRVPPPEVRTGIGLATELGQAVLSQSTPRVLELIDAGAPLDIPLIGIQKTPLELAIEISLERGATDSTMVKALLSHGMTYPRSEWRLAKLITLAEKTGDPELLQLAVNRGLDFTKKTPDGDATGIELLLSFGGPVTNKWLLTQPTLMEYSDITGRTVPQIAIEQLNSDLLQNCLAAGFTLETEAKQALSPLHLVFDAQSSTRSQQRQEVASLILGQGDFINQPAPLTGETPLFKALTSGDIDTARFLIEHNADLHATSNTGETMIHAFAKGGNADPFLDTLLKAGIDLNAQVLPNNDTALHIALREGHVDVAQLLIKKGADSTIVNDKGETALHLLLANKTYARDNPLALDTLRDVIVESFGGLMVQLSTGETPAHIIFRHSEIPLPNAFLEHVSKDLDFSAVDSKGNTLLHAAAANPDTGLLLAMLRRDVDVTTKNHDGETVLHIAARYPISWESLRESRDWGDGIDVKDRWGRTPLDIANGNTQDSLISEVFNHVLSVRDQVSSYWDNEQFFAAKSGSTPFPFPASPEDLEKWRQLSFLAHTWEIKGQVQIGAFQANLEGSSTRMHIPYIRQGIASLWASHPNLMSAHQGLLISTLLDNSIEKHFWNTPISATAFINQSTILSEIQAGGSGLIHTGFLQHAIEIAFHNGYLLVCNRGAGTNQPIEAYKIDTTLLTTDILDQFSFEHYADYKTDLPKVIAKLQGQKDAVCESLEKLDPLRRFQVVGNCAYESVETALFGVLALDELLGSGGDPYADQLAIASSFEVFQALSNNLRLNALEGYLELFGSNPERGDFPMAHQLMQDLFGRQLQELEEPSGQALAAELVQLGVNAKPTLPNEAKSLLDHMFHCRYVMHNTHSVAQKCLEEYMGMPRWREQMEERFGELKGRYHRLYGTDPALLSINNAAQRIGFQRSIT